MPYRKEKFENEDIVHIILRGIDGVEIFKDVSDYFRIIFSIYEFNDIYSATIRRRREVRNAIKNKIYRGRASADFPDQRDRLVDILTFCFIPNHVHLLIRQIKDDGITKFISKVGTGYAGYFNRKYQRKGHLFQDVFKAVRIETNEQLMTVVAYIHTNPLSLKYPQWKEVRLENPAEAMKFLEECKWSSHPDYAGIQNFPSVTQRDFILDLFGSAEKYKEFVLDYIAQKGESKKYTELFLE